MGEHRECGETGRAGRWTRLRAGITADLRTRGGQVAAVGWIQGAAALAAAGQEVLRQAGGSAGSRSLLMVVPIATLVAVGVAAAALALVLIGLRLAGRSRRGRVQEPISGGRIGGGSAGFRSVSFLGRDHGCGPQAAPLLRYGIVVGYANLAIAVGLLPADLLAGCLML